MQPSMAPSVLKMRSLRLLHTPLLWLPFLLSTITAQVPPLPYNPTRVLQNGTLLYVFQPSEGSSSQFELGAVDLSSQVAASAIPYTTLYPTLPFLDPVHLKPFTPILDSGGIMTVYTGDCRAGASGAEVWIFIPTLTEISGNGTWTRTELSFDKIDEDATAIGANYLSNGIAFSAVVDSDENNNSAYFFGGMCPSQGKSEDWQHNAEYSNLLVSLEPSADGSQSMSYQVDVPSSRGPPIPEAGFTLTGLTPSYSNRSDGAQNQQQNFVLVGGHTSSAFINMSQVALFSLPQQGWTFIPVLQPNPERTDLAIRKDFSEIEPRSGHTAVLTPDGQKIIVFGGWIGDIDTPAEPQLAILNIGEGYGGKGGWEWTVPATSEDGMSSNPRIYGHGAVVLPGGVMMITGGYSIPPQSSHQRRASSTLNSKTLFFDIASNSWIAEYSPPEPTSAAPAKLGPLSTTPQKAGLGVGLGVGMAAAITLGVFYLWYTRRLKRHRQAREKQLQDLSLGAHRYTLDCLSPGIDGRGGNVDASDYLDDPNDSYFYPTVGSPQNRGWRHSNGHEAERTGLLVEIPSPTRGLRRSLNGRTGHHMSRYDERRVQGSGNIHPIDELEEEQEQRDEPEQGHGTENIPLTTQPEMTEKKSNRPPSIFNNVPVLDPFFDASHTRYMGLEQQKVTLSYSAPSSPMHEEQHHMLTDGVLAASTLQREPSFQLHGRSSPEKSDRTGSNLSERSMRSNLSSASSTSITRAVSIQSTALLKNVNHSNPFLTLEVSPAGSKSRRSSGGGGWESPDARTRSFTSVRSTGRPTTADGDSFMTARTSFMQLQVEGEALLGGNPDKGRPDTSSTSNGSTSRQQRESSMNPTGTLTAVNSTTDGPITRTKRKPRWLGSVRKALARTSSIRPEARTRSLTASTAPFERYTDSPTLQPISPIDKSNRKSFPASAAPRRSASDASFWRSKRGKQDWLDDELDPNDPHTIWKRTSGDDWGAPEDVAHAERERQKREWRERSTNLINLVDGSDDQRLPTPRSLIHPGDLGDINAATSLGADDEDWDVEAAVERRVVQVMFTVPRTRLRVVNADVDRSSIMSMPQDMESAPNDNTGSHDHGSSGAGADGTSTPTPPSPSRVKDLVSRFENRSPSPVSLDPSPSHYPSGKAGPPLSACSPGVSASSRISTPAPSPSNSIASFRLRQKRSQRSLNRKRSVERLRGVGRLVSADITSFGPGGQ